MNDLIISIAKERLLPVSSEVIDYPNAQTENQMHRLSVYVTKIILDAFLNVTHWALCNITHASKRDPTFLSEDIRLSLALKNLFPLEWLEYAEQSPAFYLKLQRVIERYRFTLKEATVKRIHRIVEFLCFEIIESAVLWGNCKPMSELTPEDLQSAIDADPILKHIIYRHNLYLVIDYPSNERVQISSSELDLSLKATRLLRTYAEEMIREVIRSREHEDRLTLRDVDSYFKINLLPQ